MKASRDNLIRLGRLEEADKVRVCQRSHNIAPSHASRCRGLFRTRPPGKVGGGILVGKKAANCSSTTVHKIGGGILVGNKAASCSSTSVHSLYTTFHLETRLT